MQSTYGYKSPPRSWMPVGSGIYRSPARPSLGPSVPMATANPAPSSDYPDVPARPRGSGDPTMDAMLQSIMSRYGARSRGARLGALASAGEDPSLGAYAGTQAGLNEQGQTARSLNDYVAQLLSQREGRSAEYSQQEKMARLQMQLQMEAQKKAQGNPLWGTVGQVLGAGLGGWASGGFAGLLKKGED
jgi:hypothetical protein